MKNTGEPELILDYHIKRRYLSSMPYTTQQKLALAETIMKAERPLTPDEICREVQREIPHLGRATVYRALKQFVAEGQVRPVEIPGVPTHYESAARQHHHFFFCHHCRRLYNLLGCVRGVLGLAPKGFAVKRHEIVLYGDCARCRARA
ncbi:MAG TPA: transcriptional repressor [Opitutaceae bacterium]|jgi:Fur family ferric uptake transcriptional regulator|nr:transcriptional repressor [Opitutaceae bacterium]